MPQSGIWGIGPNINTKTLLQTMPFLKGFHLTEKWSDIEPSPGVYNFADMNKYFTAGVSLNLDLGFMVWTGANAPDWLYQEPYNVPKLEINTGAAGQLWGHLFFPYYYDSIYKNRFRMMLTAVVDNLAAQPAYILEKIKFIQSAEGTTGDEGAYHGDIVRVTIGGVPVDNPEDYAIPEAGTDPGWDAYKKEIWAFLDGQLKSRVNSVRMMLNPGNNAFNWTFAQEIYPDAYLKHGDMSHNWAFQGNNYYTEYMQQRTTEPEMFTRGEFDMADKVAINWNTHDACPQAVFCMIAHALHANMTSLNLPLQTYNYFKCPDYLSYDFFNEYATPTGPGAALRKGFAYLRRQVNIADTDLYTELEFGPLIEPAMQKRYDTMVRLINADTNSNEWNKLTRITNNKISMANPVRKEKLALAFAQYGFQFGPIANRDNDNWNYDYNYDSIEGNYKRYVNQVNPYASTKPMVRVGDPAVDQLGRYALYTETEMFFECTSEGLTPRGNNHVTITVYYWNENVGTVRLFFHNGLKKTAMGSITTTDTRQYLQATFLVTNFKGGQRLANDCDFSIRKVNGKNVPISLITVSALSAPPTGEERDGDEDCFTVCCRPNPVPCIPHY